MRGKAVTKRMHRYALAQTRRGTRRAAGGIKYLHVDRPALVPAGEQPVVRTGQAPVGPQNVEKLRRQHDIAVLAALAMLDAHNLRLLSMSLSFRPAASDARSPAA